MKQYLFAYGTLTNEFAPPEISKTLKKLRCVGDGFVYGRLYNLGDFPGAILNRSARNKIFGKIFELPDDPHVLQILDEYEEFFPHRKSKSLFVRRQVPVNRVNGERLKGWIYLFNGDVKSSPVIPGGDYSKIAA